MDRILTSLRTEICINDENIQEKQTLFDSLKNELKQKRQNLDELNTIYRNKEDAYGVWMSDCLKAIQNDDRFHKKPIGPIGNAFKIILTLISILFFQVIIFIALILIGHML